MSDIRLKIQRGFFSMLVVLLSFSTDAVAKYGTATHSSSQTSGTFIKDNTLIQFCSSEGSQTFVYYVPMNEDYTVKIQRYNVQGPSDILEKKYWNVYIRTDDDNTTMSTDFYTVSPALKRFSGGYMSAWNKSGTLTALSFDNAITLEIKANSTVGDRIRFQGQASQDKAMLNHDYDASVCIVIGAYSYRVKYDANGGSGAPADQTVAWTSDYEHESTHTFTLSSTIPTRPGYTFDGWYDAASGGNIITGATTLTGVINQEVAITLYAHWTPTPYTATFDANGGTCGTTSINYTIENIFKMPTPIRTGYQFVDWEVKSVGSESDKWTVGNKYESNVSSPSSAYGNVTFVAEYTKDGYKITYDANGGSVSSTEQTYDYETNVSLLTPQRPGYHFLNWKVKETSGSWTKDETYAAGTALGTKKYGNVTLVAQWEEGESDLTVSISNLQTDEYVLFKIVGLTGKGKDKEYTMALNSAKTSVSMKELPTGSYRVTAMYWSQSEDVNSVVNPTTVTEDHDIAGGYEFKFVASKKTSPQPHAEASKNNVWAKQ